MTDDPADAGESSDCGTEATPLDPFHYYALLAKHSPVIEGMVAEFVTICGCDDGVVYDGDGITPEPCPKCGRG